MDRKTRGDVLRINITPASTTFPWIKIYRHPYEIKRAGHETNYPGAGAQNRKTRREVAFEIGEDIIRSSKVLKSWFKKR